LFQTFLQDKERIEPKLMASVFNDYSWYSFDIAPVQNIAP